MKTMRDPDELDGCIDLPLPTELRRNRPKLPLTTQDIIFALTVLAVMGVLVAVKKWLLG